MEVGAILTLGLLLNTHSIEYDIYGISCRWFYGMIANRFFGVQFFLIPNTVTIFLYKHSIFTVTYTIVFYKRKKFFIKLSLIFLIAIISSS